MRTAADYFGLMAYLFVMHGGVPDDAPIMLEDYRKLRTSTQRKTRLRAMKSSTRPARRRAAAATADEAVA